MFDFEFQLKTLPDKPGVYLMKNSLGEIIYVGKAKILKNRVRQYFQSSKTHSDKVKAMVENISEFEYIVTDNEIEALILECNLIKKHRPKYNILLKDDKRYPFIKITINEDFPRVFVTRNIARDGAKYFGPYVNVSAVYETIELLKKLFPIRNCKRAITQKEKYVRPCLNYFIGLCSAPCGGKIDKVAYNKIVDSLIRLLSGKNRGIISTLKEDMEKYAENLDFEKAAVTRDKINAVEKVIEKQKITTGSFEDEDFINLYSDEKDSCAVVFFLRDGKITGREHFIIDNTSGMDDGEIISNFIKQFYGWTAFIPKKIYLPACDEIELYMQWLTIKRGNKAEVRIPFKGEKKQTIELVKKNAKMILENFKNKFKEDKEINLVALNELTDVLNLEEIPHRIEAYDISNIQGMDSVGTMVVAEDGRPKYSDYRRFKIKDVIGADDYASMREVLSRRFKHGIAETKAVMENKINLSAGKFCIFPDLILMDGGKGQVNIALEVLKEFNINIPVCGMVKDDTHSTRGLIFNNEEIIIVRHSNLMHLITRIQDEAHRFAITYHRSMRDKKMLHSILDDIPNVGDKRRKALLINFGSIENIKNAKLENIEKVASIDKKTAKGIYDFFHIDRDNNMGGKNK